jgi:hypothetical protein
LAQTETPIPAPAKIPQSSEPPKPAPQPQIGEPPKPAPPTGEPPKPATNSPPQPQIGEPPRPAPQINNEPPKPVPKPQSFEPPKPAPQPQIGEPPKPVPKPQSFEPPKPAPQTNGEPPKPAPQTNNEPPKPATNSQPQTNGEPPKPATNTPQPRYEPPKPQSFEPPRPAPQTNNEPPKPATNSQPQTNGEPPKPATNTPQPRNEPPKPAPQPTTDKTSSKEVTDSRDNIENKQTEITQELNKVVTTNEAQNIGETSATTKDNVITCTIIVTFSATATQETRDKFAAAWKQLLLALCADGVEFGPVTWTKISSKRQTSSTEMGTTQSTTQPLNEAPGRIVSVFAIFALSLLLLVF